MVSAVYPVQMQAYAQSFFNLAEVERSTAKLYSTHHFRHFNHPTVRAYAVPKVAWIRSKILLDGCRLLEVGAGNGYMTHELKKWCYVTALDVSKTQLRHNPADRKVIGTAYELPFTDASFEVVLCANLLHHLNEPSRAIAEMERVTKRYVVVSEPNLKNPYNALAAVIPFLALKSERNIRHYTRAFLLKMLEANGMRVIHHTYQGGMVSPKVNPWFLLRFSLPQSMSSLSTFQIAIAEKLWR